MLNMSLLFSAGCKSTKTKFSGSFVILCCGRCVLVQIVPALFL
jgi:hypothetical protein